MNLSLTKLILIVNFVNKNSINVIVIILYSNMNFHCNKCLYSTNVKQNYSNHLLSKKHNKQVLETNEIKAFSCNKCNKVYKSYVGLWKHNKKQTCHEKTRSTLKNTSETNTKELIEIIQSMKQQQTEMMEKIEILTTKPTTNTNNITINNNIINILKNDYNDVITFDEFIGNIHINYHDIENIKDIDSCIECLNNIIIKQLKDYEINRRPFHCIRDGDENTETFLKNNEWIQEYVIDYDNNNTPILDKKFLIFIAKINEDINSMNIDNEEKSNLRKLLKLTTKKNNLSEIKNGLFYGIHINKYELNYNLIENKPPQ